MIKEVSIRMKLLAKTGIVVVALLIEFVLANILGLNTIKPDLMLIVVICMSFISGTEEGTIVGFAGGLLKDVFSVHFLGINALVKSLIGYIAGVIRERIFSQHIMWVVAISTFIFTFINNIIIFFLLNALHTNYDFAITIRNFVLSQAIINSIISPFLFIGIKKIFIYISRWS
jgi:rod shape-determining protein MreD